MKTKNILYFSMAVLSLSLIACDSLIEIAPIPSQKVNSEKYTFSETFENGLGTFTQYNDSGKQIWMGSKYKYISMSGSIDNVPYANEDWLISPAIILPAGNTSVIAFDYVTRGFANLATDVTMMVSEDYNPDSLFKKATWKAINTIDPLINSASWNMSNSGDISLKAFMGKKVNIAFKYVSNNTQAGTWQIKNFVVKDRVPVTLPYSEPFLSSKGKFVAINVSGSQVWTLDSHGYMNMSGYVSPTNFANEDWLISPKIDFTKLSHAKLTFDQVTRYFGTIKTEATLWYSEQYDEGLPNTVTDWKQLKTYPFSDPGNWTLTTSHELTLDSCVGKKVSIAFKYISTAAKAGTWELKNFNVQEGVPSDIYFYEGFNESLGGFTQVNIKGTTKWTFSSSYGAVMSGTAKLENESWLISPVINLTGRTSAKISFDNAINFGVVANMKTNQSMWLSADNGTTWEPAVIPIYPAGNNWTFVNSGDVVIPDKYLGVSTFKFAFKYLSTTTDAATWEIKNVVIKP